MEPITIIKELNKEMIQQLSSYINTQASAVTLENVEKAVKEITMKYEDYHPNIRLQYIPKRIPRKIKKGRFMKKGSLWRDRYNSFIKKYPTYIYHRCNIATSVNLNVPTSIQSAVVDFVITPETVTYEM